MIDPNQQTLSDVCQTTFQYEASSTQVIGQTQICFQPIKAFAVDGALFIAFVAIIILTAKKFQK